MSNSIIKGYNEVIYISLKNFKVKATFMTIPINPIKAEIKNMTLHMYIRLTNQRYGEYRQL